MSDIDNYEERRTVQELLNSVEFGRFTADVDSVVERENGFFAYVRIKDKESSTDAIPALTMRKILNTEQVVSVKEDGRIGVRFE